MKLVKKDTILTYFYYVRDAQGNPGWPGFNSVMAVYKPKIHKESTNIFDSLTLTEQDMYGSMRLGMVKQKKLIQRFNYTGSVDTVTGKPTVSATLLDTNFTDNDSIFNRILGQKKYELSNHLGNVLATVSDRKLQHSSDSTSVDYYLPDILTATEYYAFGAELPLKKYKDTCYNVVTTDTTYATADSSLAVIFALGPGDQIVFNIPGITLIENFMPGYTLQDYINDIIGWNAALSGSHPGFTFSQLGSSDTVMLLVDHATCGLGCGDVAHFMVGFNHYDVTINCNPIVSYDTSRVCTSVLDTSEDRRLIAFCHQAPVISKRYNL